VPRTTTDNSHPFDGTTHSALVRVRPVHAGFDLSQVHGNVIAVVGHVEIRQVPDVAPFFELRSSTGQHHFDPVNRGSQPG
jgi:hypothetical protein